MIINNNLFCFILAGGEGSRLKNLTKDTCKPLVKVCSLFHLIDFSLINCLISGMHNIAVIVQYESIDLIKYLFESNINSLTNFYILPPKTNQESSENIHFRNTAHSVYSNLDILDDDIDDVLILSADHIYAMKYNKFYQHHKDAGNDLTVSVVNVSQEEASRFGIFSLDEDDNIIDFEEKPKNPKSTFASMGVYIFKKDMLLKVLDELVESIGPDLDFGKHVVPYFLKHYKTGVYKFPWYWVDLGTIDAFWSFNMYVLDHSDFISKFLDSNDMFKISRGMVNSMPAYFEENAAVSSSIIGNNSHIKGEITHSIIGNNVKIGDRVAIRNSVVMDNCEIKDGVLVENAVISQNSVIDENVISGDEIICK